MSVMGSTYSTNIFTLSCKPAFRARIDTTKGFGATKRVASAKKNRTGLTRRVYRDVYRGVGLPGPGCGRLCGEQARPKEQALAFADLARGLGAVDVAYMRSALGLSSTSPANRTAASPACGKPLLLRSHKGRTEDGLSEQCQHAAPFVNFMLHDVAHAQQNSKVNTPWTASVCDL
jgi:hypothetical protein